jgi:catechol 2,3-dioxygenase
MGTQTAHERFRLPADTHMGAVSLTVGDLERQIAFHQESLGFRLHWREGDEAGMGADGEDLLRFKQISGARRARGVTGLYHTAILLASKWELAQTLRRIAETRAPIQGTSNHGTHLALYLADEEGNGLELAWDFPPESWPMKDGRVDFEMVNRSGVDMDDLLAELQRDPRPWAGLDAATAVGHVHLRVASLAASRRFYVDMLGFDLTADLSAMGALFASAGGYHHHLGMNTWLGEGAPPPPADALGLRYITIRLPSAEALEALRPRLMEQGAAYEARDDGLFLRDPAGNGVMVAG